MKNVVKPATNQLMKGNNWLL